MAKTTEIMGVTERTFRRWRDRYEAERAEGLQDRRLGRASGQVYTTRLTQVHRALQQLGITLIPAYSPEARGRELALAAITGMAGATTI